LHSLTADSLGEHGASISVESDGKFANGHFRPVHTHAQAAAYMYMQAVAAAQRGGLGGAGLPWGYTPYLFPYGGPYAGAYPPNLDYAGGMNPQAAQAMKLAVAKAAANATVGGLGSGFGAYSVGSRAEAKAGSKATP